MQNEPESVAQADVDSVETGEPDYKALYERAKANSRKWEKQAKANIEAAEGLESAQAAQRSAEERISALEAQLAEKEKAEARAAIASKVAEAKGIPADLIVGDDEEAMSAYADRLLAFFAKAPAPKIESPGRFDRSDQSGDGMREFTRQLLGMD